MDDWQSALPLCNRAMKRKINRVKSAWEEEKVHEGTGYPDTAIGKAGTVSC